MKHKIIYQFVFGLFFVFGAFAVNANAQGTVGINGSIGKAERGKPAIATVIMSIPGGLHVNSSRPLSRYAIPTRITASGTGVTVGAVSYPRGKNRKFSFQDEQISVYEGRTTFRIPITVRKNFKGDTAKIQVKVRYQSCSDEVCYPERTKEITLTASIK